MMFEVHCQDSLKFLESRGAESVQLVYIDPPFNRGYPQRNEDGEGFEDDYGDWALYRSFLKPRLEETHRVLTANGSLFFHIDWHYAHYIKVFLLDEIFGRENCMNEIIWSYDYGGRPRRRWAQKHDTIFWYVKDPENYTFNLEASDRIPYMAPSLVGEEKAARGKIPTDVWWNTIVPTNSKERTGYPTQKPLSILERIVLVHSNPGDTVLDFFCGSGTTGIAAVKHGRNAILVDNNPDACAIASARYNELMEQGSLLSLPASLE